MDASVNEQPTAYDLWIQAGGGTAEFTPERYRELMIQHGLLVPLKPGEKAEPVPCGWPAGRTGNQDPADGLA